MNEQLRANKQAIRAFLGTEVWTEEKLCGLLAHAQNGRLSYVSCCCLRGAATADHPLRGKYPHYSEVGGHYNLSECLPGAIDAAIAYSHFGIIGSNLDTEDLKRCRKIVPIIRAELRRRARASQPQLAAQEMEAVL